MKNTGQINIVLIGGSGFWSETNHYNHILKIKKDTPIKVVAIVDLINPYSIQKHSRLKEILALDKPVWVNPQDFSSETATLDHVIQKCTIDLVIIASNPCTHFAYGKACIELGLNTVCDKPIISGANAAIDTTAAQTILRQYDELSTLYSAKLKEKPSLLFHSILRRRGLRTFCRVAEDLSEVYISTGAGINSMNVIVNGGKYEFPQELLAPGAHGYTDGVGSISHSAYHYIDLIAWYIQQAPGAAVYLRPRLNYVYRVRDYIAAKAYKSIARVIKDENALSQNVEFSEAILGSELNSGYTLDILDREKNLLGTISFVFNHVSFTPRTLLYDPAVVEPADSIGGGRMSQVIIDVHQDGLLNWQINKNDIVFEDNIISAACRRHPLITTDEKPAFELLDEEAAYEKGVTLYDALKDVIASVAKGEQINNHPVTRSLVQEVLATRIYASLYQLLAAEYEHSPAPEILLSLKNVD